MNSWQARKPLGQPDLPPPRHVLAHAYATRTLAGAAAHLGVSVARLQSWMRQVGLPPRRVSWRLLERPPRPGRPPASAGPRDRLDKAERAQWAARGLTASCLATATGRCPDEMRRALRGQWVAAEAATAIRVAFPWRP